MRSTTGSLSLGQTCSHHALPVAAAGGISAWLSSALHEPQFWESAQWGPVSPSDDASCHGGGGLGFHLLPPPRVRGRARLQLVANGPEHQQRLATLGSGGLSM